MRSTTAREQNRRERHSVTRTAAVVLVLLTLTASACARRQPPPLAQPAPPAGAPPVTTTAPPAPPPTTEALPVPPEPLAIAEDGISARSLDDLNRDSPFKPAFFPLDSAELDDDGRAVVTANAAVMRKFPRWMITVEGHCDERGTAEYNLALGERRALAVRTYLVSLGIAADRVRVVSYGKEFPFDPLHTESAWSKNRRAHFVLTSK
jgi:peptidoglycan-associated lipoprotein